MKNAAKLTDSNYSSWAHPVGKVSWKNLEELIKKLTPELKQEVVDFIQFLLSKKAGRKGRKLRQDWGGGLEEYRQQYTSMQLQKKALEWRGG